MLNAVDDDDSYNHNECTKGRRTNDDRDENRLVATLKQQGVFHNPVQLLQNMMNKDMVTTNIQESLLNGERLGKEQLMSLLNNVCANHLIVIRMSVSKRPFIRIRQ